MSRTKINNLYVFVAIPMGFVAFIGIVFGIISDPDFMINLIQNLPSELIGVSLGILITVLYVDRIIKLREFQFWNPVRSIIFNTINANIKVALNRLCTYGQFSSTFSDMNSKTDELVRLVQEEDYDKFASLFLVNDIQIITDILEQHMRNVIEIIDRGLPAISQLPDLLKSKLELQSTLNYLINSVKLHERDMANQSIQTFLPTETIKDYVVLLPLFKHIEQIIYIHQKAKVY